MYAVTIPMEATARSLSVRVLIAAAGPTPPTEITLEVAGETVGLASWRSLSAGADQVWFTSHRAGSLEPATRYEIELRAGGTTLSRSTATTLPDSDHAVGLIFGSCFDSDQADQLVGPMYDQLEAMVGQDAGAHINLWLGDQVYVDAPWQRGFFPSDPRKKILGKYLATWGLDARRGRDGLAYAMSHASNWYLPDDHEFWNGYPHPSFFTLPFHTVGRLAYQAGRWLWPALNRPPHPHVQGRWGRAAGEAYCAFQTNLDFERFDENVSPPQIQTIDVGGALIVLVDTRWHRTIRKTGGQAGFMPGPDLEDLVALLSQEQRLVCLALSRPVLGRLPHTGVLRRKVEYSAEDYGAQYVALWEALNRRADRGRATVILGGDVHKQSVKTSLDDHILEVVSSPLALLECLDDEEDPDEHEDPTKIDKAVAGVRRGWRWIKATSFDLVTGDDQRRAPHTTAAPRIDAGGSWQATNGTAHLPPREPRSGLSAVTIDAADPEKPLVTVHVARVVGGQLDQLWVQTFKWLDGWS
jgi:hypothetical protein